MEIPVPGCTMIRVIRSPCTKSQVLSLFFLETRGARYSEICEHEETPKDSYGNLCFQVSMKTMDSSFVGRVEATGDA